MNNEKKFERIIALLDEKGISHEENCTTDKCSVGIDLLVPKYNIAAFDGDSQEKFLAVRGIYAPFFVRESETEDFTVKKMKNLLADRMKSYLPYLERKAKAEERRRYTEECERRHQEKVAARAERKRIMEEKAAAKAKTAKQKRKRIVRYEKV